MPATPRFNVEQLFHTESIQSSKRQECSDGWDGHSSLLQQGPAQISMNSSLDIVFRVCLKRSFPAPLVACPVHFLTWFLFLQTVPWSGNEGHLFASFTNSLLRSRLLLKAALRLQSCVRAEKWQAGECQRANRLPADSTSPLLKLSLIKNSKSRKQKEKKS